MALQPPKGNPEEWNSIWQDFGKEDSSREKRQLFTRGSPKTLLQFWQRCYFEDLKRLLPHQVHEMSFLELGAGRGTLSMYLASEGATELTMVDLSKKAFELARLNFSREGIPIPRFVFANAEHTGLPAACCDCVTSLGLLEHFEDPSPTLRESFRLLKPEGFTYQVIVPAVQLRRALLCMFFFKPLSFFKQVFRLGKSEAKRSEDQPMIRTEIDRAAYLRMAREAGFVKCACIPYNPYWNVNREGWFQEQVALRFYAAHHQLKKLFLGPRSPSLKTSPAFELCYLLVGSKP